jgi:hypothetical protein
MITRKEIKSITRAIIENNKLLGSCALHEFELADPAARPSSFTKYRCRNCGGTVDAIQHRWYETGLKHGKETYERT